MVFEIFGFLAGGLAIAVAGAIFVRHEHWKTIRGAYGRDRGRSGGGGNALIWPSH